jgi:hypothetical protein
MANGVHDEGAALVLPGLTMKANPLAAAPRPRGAPAARRRGQQGRRAQIASGARSGAAAARTLDVIEHVVTLASAMDGEALFGLRLLDDDDLRVSMPQ